MFVNILIEISTSISDTPSQKILEPDFPVAIKKPEDAEKSCIHSLSLENYFLPQESKNKSRQIIIYEENYKLKLDKICTIKEVYANFFKFPHINLDNKLIYAVDLSNKNIGTLPVNKQDISLPKWIFDARYKNAQVHKVIKNIKGKQVNVYQIGGNLILKKDDANANSSIYLKSGNDSDYYKIFSFKEPFSNLLTMASSSDIHGATVGLTLVYKTYKDKRSYNIKKIEITM